MYDTQTNRQNIYEIDTHWLDELSPKFSDIYLE